MASSRWQANKIGLINFWYYDEQEFLFSKGRMLLRGSNGSGKSVTMQSVIPLLLDGNMSPERLDPFGSRDRKMNSYLLEEGDELEERIGYLYLEFKRESSDTYLTVGMGMRARKGKPLDKWYFGLSDGRRIGHDFFLYKEMGDKITLTKRELTNRMGHGGQVMERQADYMEYVNRQIFGFETVEEYKEMIDLLIQLRTPKLSKDFKPTVVSEILSDSLQPLSDEELRPMSEAIENMDTMNINLKSRQESQVAAAKINRVLERYNRLLLWEKAALCMENQEKIDVVQEKQKELEQNQANATGELERLECELQELKIKKESFEKEKELLQQSDLWGLKQKEIELKSEIEDKEKTSAEKQKQEEQKKERKIELEHRMRKEIDARDQGESQITELLEDMQVDADEMEFQEHAFMASELVENIVKPYIYITHELQLNQTKVQIQEGVVQLKECEYLQRQVEDYLERRDTSQKEVDAYERKLYEAQSVFVSAQNEWKESLYSWSGRNQELILSSSILQELSAKVDLYELQTDFSEMKQMVSPTYESLKSELELTIARNREEERKTQESLRVVQVELEEWKNQKEPVPHRSDAVNGNRAHLRELGIPYHEFYKLLEFDEHLSSTECNNLEEALLNMGILDAVVLDEKYREQVLAFEQGDCDKYLFMQSGKVENSLLDILRFNDNLVDIFLNLKMTNVLGSIGFNQSGVTTIWEDGSYQIGVVTGTITGTYEAGYLGTKTRERNRLRKIEECQTRIAELEKLVSEIANTVGNFEERKQQIVEEYQGFPMDKDMRTALQLVDEAQRSQQQYKREVEDYESKITDVSKEKNERYKVVSEIAKKLYLTCTLSVFECAQKAVGQYEQKFYQLKQEHGLYLQHVKSVEALVEDVEDIDIDLDNIRYEISKLRADLRKGQVMYDGVQEQLGAEGFEEQQIRMEECTNWLKEFPNLLQECVTEREKTNSLLIKWREEEVINKCRSHKLENKQSYLQLCYEKEAELQYVKLPEEVITVTDIVKYLEVECKSMSQNKETLNLNQVIFENQNYLMDYQITTSSLFQELDDQKEQDYPESSRMDVSARYQGVKVDFGKLLQQLDEEIEELKALIQDGDRELFEDILANTVSRKIRGKINSSKVWVDKMNGLMNGMNTSSGLRLSLKWRHKTAENESQLDTKELVEYLKRDYRLLREEESERLSKHFRSKVEEARRRAKDSGGTMSFYQVMKDTLDYRKWFEFQLFSQKTGERVKELTNSVFGTFSGGEKAMAMYVPLFSAVVAKYQGGSPDAPRMLSLDEAFAGVDNKNIRDMFRLMAEFEFEFIINSQVLWGDVDILDALAIYQLMRPANAKFVTVMPYIWNGQKKELLEDEGQMEKQVEQLSGSTMS